MHTAAWRMPAVGCLLAACRSAAWQGPAGGRALAACCLAALPLGRSLQKDDHLNLAGRNG
eukprot:141-Chlamydomonas_euryale.AAC.2